MWFARGTDEPATSMKVRLLSDLSRGMVPKQTDSELDHCGRTVKGRNTPLETAKTARNGCRGNEEKELCVVSILLLIDTVRGNN